MINKIKRGIAFRDMSNYKNQFFSFFISNGWGFKQVTHLILGILVQMGIGVPKPIQEVTKVFSLVKRAENLPSVTNPLEIIFLV